METFPGKRRPPDSSATGSRAASASPDPRSASSRSSDGQLLFGLHRWDRATGATSTVLSGRTTSSMSDEERSCANACVRPPPGSPPTTCVTTASWPLRAGPCWCGTTRTARVGSRRGGRFDPRLSPDGSTGSRGWNQEVFTCGPGRHQPSILAGPEGEESWAVADFIAAEELSRSRGYWWLPDSTGILVQRTDESPVPIWYRSDPAHPPPGARCPAVHPHAGANNTRRTVAIRPGREGERIRLPTSEYLAGVGAGVVMDREQTELTVCDRRSRSGANISSRGSTWFPGLPRIDPAGRLLGWTDDDRRLTIDGEPIRGDVTRPGGRRCAARVRHRLHRSGGEPAVVEDAGFRWLSSPGTT